MTTKKELETALRKVIDCRYLSHAKEIAIDALGIDPEDEAFLDEDMDELDFEDVG